LFSLLEKTLKQIGRGDSGLEVVMYGRDHDQLPFFLNHPAVIGASSLSMTMSLLTIGSFVIFSDLRKLRYVELLTYVAFNDVLFSICTLMGNMKEGSIGCYFQGIVGSLCTG
jgi:hypothetical protein